MKQNMRSVMLLDLDPEITVGDVRGVLGQTLDMDMREIGSVRVLDSVNRMGKKSAFITIPAEMAFQLLNKKRVGMRWDRWRVRDVVTPRRCFTCKQIGHEAKDCKAKGKGEICHICGEFVLIKRDCKNDTACYICRRSGLPGIQEHGAGYEDEGGD